MFELYSIVRSAKFEISILAGMKKLFECFT